MNERGSAVVSALAGITMLTLVTLTTFALGLSAVNVLVIRDAAIDASQQAALAKKAKSLAGKSGTEAEREAIKKQLGLK